MFSHTRATAAEGSRASGEQDNHSLTRGGAIKVRTSQTMMKNEAEDVTATEEGPQTGRKSQPRRCIYMRNVLCLVPNKDPP